MDSPTQETQDTTLDDTQPQTQHTQDALAQETQDLDATIQPTQPLEMETDVHTQLTEPPSQASLPVEPQPQSQTKPTKVKAPPPPLKRDPGKSLLPLARVQKIMKADRQLPACAKEAAVLISIAAEEFIKRLVESGHSQALREKRTTIQQKDLAVVVKRQDELLFLEEIIPAPVPSAPKQRAPKYPAPAPGYGTGTGTIADAWGRIPLPPRIQIQRAAPPPQPAPPAGTTALPPQAIANMDTT